MPESRPRVVLADDHLLCVKSLERLLETDVEVVGTAGDGRALLAQTATSRPDVVVCEISLPELDGLEATRRLAARDPEVRVVILSRYTDPVYVQAAFQAGAWGYVVKHATPEELLTAIREVSRGRYFLSPAVTAALVRAMEQARRDGDGGSDSRTHLLLTPREREVLDLLGEGLTNPRIAHRLSVSVATVRTHLSHLYTKLGCTNRVELALYGRHADRVEPGEGQELRPTESSRS